jgi:DNA-directed RNA polymerase subunit RPC12/RpoP
MGLAFIIIGVDYLTWGSEQTEQPIQCGTCGQYMRFIKKKGMRFVTIFFFIPIFPVSGVTHLVECPNCKTRYQPIEPTS